MAGTATKTLQYKIGADLGELRRQLEAGGDFSRKMKNELAELEKKQRQHREALRDLGVGFTAFGVAVAAGLGLAAKAAIDWESSWAGVRKVVDGSDKEMAQLEGQLRQLARTLPTTHQEIAQVAESAGQLGIKRKDIAEFTKTMIDLGQTTNLTADEAASSLAKFMNIMGTAPSQVDRLGAALVALGNDGASTEQDIVDMALRIAGAGHQIGLTEAQVLGFASALSSVGIEAEAGGSAISRVMVDIAQAVNGGGAELDAFAKVAGETGTSFADIFRRDASTALLFFIQGLGRMQKQGGDVFGTLENLGFSEIRVRDTLLRAASAADLFSNSLKVGTSAWAENSALTDEANKRYQTTASKLAVGANQVKDALIDVGATVVPVVASVGQGLADMVHWWQTLPGPVKEVVTWVGLAAGAIALVGGAALIAFPKILAFRESMAAMAASSGMFGGALSKFGLFLSGPWGAALGIGATLLGVFAAASGAATREHEELAEAGRRVADVIRDQNGAINEAVRKAAAKELADKGALNLARGLHLELGQVTDALLDQGSAYDDVVGHLDDVIEANKEMVTTESGDLAWTGMLKGEGVAAQELKNKLLELHGSKNDQLGKEKDVAEATKTTTTAQSKQAQETENQGKKAKEAADALDDLVKTMNKLNNVTLSYREAQRSYIEAQDKARQSLAENGRNLDINTEAGRKNQEALDAQAAAANKLAEAAAREAEKTGGAAAGQAAMQASLEASRPAFIAMAKAMGLSEVEAKKLADAVLGIPPTAATLVTTPGSREAVLELQRVRDAMRNVPPHKEIDVGVLSQAAIDELNRLGFKTRTLPDGHVMVMANTAWAQNAIDNYIANNSYRSIPVNVQILYPSWGIGGRMGGIAAGGIVEFAQGGLFSKEEHAPMVARAQSGMVRVWAEPETDRESYIPWAMDRRARATGVLSQTADGFGYGLVPKSQLVRYAGGGTYGSSAPASTSSAASPRDIAAAVEYAVECALTGWRLEVGDGFARTVRTDTRANDRR